MDCTKLFVEYDDGKTAAASFGKMFSGTFFGPMEGNGMIKGNLREPVPTE
jgi:hypothetical protein